MNHFAKAMTLVNDGRTHNMARKELFAQVVAPVTVFLENAVEVTDRQMSDCWHVLGIGIERCLVIPGDRTWKAFVSRAYYLQQEQSAWLLRFLQGQVGNSWHFRWLRELETSQVQYARKALLFAIFGSRG